MLRKRTIYFVLILVMIVLVGCNGDLELPTPTVTLEPSSTPTLTPTSTPTPTPTLTPTSTPTPDSVQIVTLLERYEKGNQCGRLPPDGARGTITYQSRMSGTFLGTLAVSNLEPKHNYVFSINGYNGISGSDLLKSQCRKSANAAAGYCDFPFTTGDKGDITMPIPLNLPVGQYFIKFLIKDVPQNYCVALYNDADWLSFEIR